MFFGETINFKRGKDKKKRIRRRGNLLISNKVIAGYKPVQTSYIINSKNPNNISRIQYQINKEGKQAFLGLPRKLNKKERNIVLQKGYLKGDYDKDGKIRK